MGTRNRVGIGLSYWPGRLQLAGGIDSLESVLGLLKSLRLPSQGGAGAVVQGRPGEAHLQL
jgi:hypothetical protein